MSELDGTFVRMIKALYIKHFDLKSSKKGSE
jgi:hypothetical protein